MRGDKADAPSKAKALRQTTQLVRNFPVHGASKIIQDITARKQREKLLRRQADLLDQSLDAIFAWKIGGDIFYWSKGRSHRFAAHVDGS